MAKSIVEHTPYAIRPEKLLRECGGDREAAVNKLMKLVEEGVIWFPLQRYLRASPREIFRNLQKFKPHIKLPPPYRLYSYKPLYNLYLPPKFRGKYVVIFPCSDDYGSCDVLSDLYNEEIRLRAHRYDQEFSLIEAWRTPKYSRIFMEAALHLPVITPRNIRDVIYQNYPEAKTFRATWAQGLLEAVYGTRISFREGRRISVSGKRWLDISAGWGDRLLTAMALDMEYTGYDPNVKLEPGHREMIKMFGHPDRHQVIYEPFEEASISNTYDVVLSSPPYFDIEIYESNQIGQSTVSYPTYPVWMVCFLFRSIVKAWNALNDGGYLILHVGDNKRVNLAEPVNLFVENYLEGVVREGVIGISGESGYPRPVWVWRKQISQQPSPRSRHKKLASFQDTPAGFKPAESNITIPPMTLREAYPELAQVLVHHYLRVFNRYCCIYEEPIRSLLPQIYNEYPSASDRELDVIIGNGVYVIQLLRSIGAKATIDFVCNLIQ